MKNMRPTLLARLSEFVATQTGLYFPQERWGDLERGIAAAAPDFNFSDRESCAHWLLSAPLTRHMNEVLASHLSVGETYFFREKQSLEIFGEQVLAQLLQSRRQNERRFRIWSAGCSTGEEAYTIAILLDRLIPDLKEWNITILATDFNPKFLRKAAQGVYGEWSFRDAPVWLRERYFTKCSDGRFEIHPRIRKMVTFSYLNFAEDVYPSLSNNTSAMDVILCRNVLMYFTAQRAKQVAGNFYRALVDGGWLIVSPAEASHSLLSPFTPVEFSGAVLYRKMENAESKSRISDDQVMQSPRETEASPLSLPAVQVEPAATDITTVQTGQLPAQQPDEREVPSSMARSCANQGRLSEALEWCEKAITADKMNPLHHYLSATILQEQGQHEIAIQSLMRALYLDPDFVLAHFSLGNLHQSQGHYREAQRHFGNVLLLLRKHPQDEILPDAEGLTAGRLVEIATSLLASLPQSATANA
ncbi:chemotaxis protein methyltransferase cher2 [mine drainage metagenome]|uniref:Chemotaxis protein methyltransferase cher2 n=1 Tax=mine drainage metagenome TaxID=410659 RepID=A0A1J5RVU0_9ZZZZ